MAKAKLADIVVHCNRTLKLDSFEDWPGAVNGLQVENRGSVSRIAAAVDATPATVKKAADEGADLLIVHHGLFWGKTHPWTGNRYKLLRRLLLLLRRWWRCEFDGRRRARRAPRRRRSQKLQAMCPT